MNNVDRVEANPIKVDLALVHYPVCNKNKEVIGSAVTNLDLHDIARAGRTFGVDTFYVVTPYTDQHEMVRELLDHWLTGRGARYNEKRKEALSLVRLCDSLESLYEAVTEKWRQRPTVLATCARKQGAALPYNAVRDRIRQGEAFLLLFGTAWGMAPEVMVQVDGFLPPISGSADYNHLSVRSAASIVLDRLLGIRESVLCGDCPDLPG